LLLLPWPLRHRHRRSRLRPSSSRKACSPLSAKRAGRVWPALMVSACALPPPNGRLGVRLECV